MNSSRGFNLTNPLEHAIIRYQKQGGKKNAVQHLESAGDRKVAL